jgi:membrane protease YdiL (CAAX protease family)
MLGFFPLSAFLILLLSQGIGYLLVFVFGKNYFLDQPSYHAVIQILFTSLLNGSLLLFIYFTITFKYKVPFWSSIKWGNLNKVQVNFYVLTGMLLALVMGFLSGFISEEKNPPITELLKYPESAILLGIVAVLVAPFIEEVIFRGFIYPVLERRWGQYTAVFLTALMFVSLHVSQLWGSWLGISAIFFVGLLLSIVRAKTDSLFPSFLLHLSYNTTLCLLAMVGLLVGY